VLPKHRCSGKFVAPENYSHTQQLSRVKIRVRIKARVEVRVSFSYIMTIWRWEEFSRCDKFPTTPVYRY